MLELGSGYFSTPFLHWICFNDDIELWTYENGPKYFQMVKNLGSGNHHVELIESWLDVPTDKHFRVALIDHAPAERRAIDILRLNCDIFVVHDTEPKHEKTYRYNQVFEEFKYKFQYTKARPFTTIISNVVDVRELFDD